jgi:N-dimethylarginine dimethylaminohydrolase
VRRSAMLHQSAPHIVRLPELIESYVKCSLRHPSRSFTYPTQLLPAFFFVNASGIIISVPAQINTQVLMSSAEFFDDGQAINPFMDKKVAVDRQKAQAEHKLIEKALRDNSVEVSTVPAPKDCQDGVYTANWALVRGDTAVMSTLPNAREQEEPYAEQVLRDLGKKTVKVPDGIHFSGQGDALPCGDFLFIGTGYRTQKAAHDFVANTLGYTVISLQTIPKRNWYGRPLINKDSGWPDSYFYDIDLALSVLRGSADGQKGLIAWCPDAFLPESRKKLRAFDGVDKIEVSFTEAKQAFACNLVSTGEAVIMSAHAPIFTAELKRRGFTVITPEITELAKGGGYIRCTTLTLNNI